MKEKFISVSLFYMHFTFKYVKLVASNSEKIKIKKGRLSYVILYQFNYIFKTIEYCFPTKSLISQSTVSYSFFGATACLA